MRRLVILTLALATRAFSADPMTDIRTALARLGAASTVRGTLEVTSVESTEDEAPQNGKAVVGFEAGGDGLRILYPHSALSQADQEARDESADPERPTPTRNGVRRLRPLHVAELVNAGSALNVMLESCTFAGARPTIYQAKPARLLTFKFTPKMSKSQAKHVKKFDGTVSLWIGDDGVPLAAERISNIKASFLLMSFENNRKESWTYARVADRLIATRYQENVKTDGMGQHNSSQLIEVLRIE
jgi:hypothetical protein